MFRYLDDDFVSDLVGILREFTPDIIEIKQKLNYFSYFRPFGLTCLVPGEMPYRRYIDGKLGRLSLLSPYKMEIS
jgi:hypothetical protein